MIIFCGLPTARDVLDEQKMLREMLEATKVYLRRHDLITIFNAESL